MMLKSFQLGTAMGVPVYKMRFAPLAATPTPSSTRFSHSAAMSLMAPVRRAESSMNAAWAVSRQSRPLMGTGSAVRVASRRWRTRRLSFASLMAARRPSAVIFWPVSSSSLAARRLTSLRHCARVSSLRTWGTSITYVSLSRPNCSYAFFLPSQVFSPTTRSALSMYGQTRASLKPMKPLMRGQVLRGTYFSASSGAHSAPAHRPTSTAPAAVTTSSGT